MHHFRKLLRRQCLILVTESLLRFYVYLDDDAIRAGCHGGEAQRGGRSDTFPVAWEGSDDNGEMGQLLKGGHGAQISVFRV